MSVSPAKLPLLGTPLRCSVHCPTTVRPVHMLTPLTYILVGNAIAYAGLQRNFTIGGMLLNLYLFWRIAIDYNSGNISSV